jgi:hypothetical protein
MIKILHEKHRLTLFFISLLCFVAVLPFSTALVSIFGGAMLFAALIEDSWRNKIQRLKENKILLFIPGVFFVYLISLIVFYKTGNSLYDLKKTIFFLIVPMAFIIGKPLTNSQSRQIFYIFILSVFVAIIVAMINWSLNRHNLNFDMRQITLVSHIRFSFQLILGFWFTLILFQKNYRMLPLNVKFLLILLAFSFIGFLFFQQSLTGLFAFCGSVLFYFIFIIGKIQSRYLKILISLIIGIVLIPILYVTWVVVSFYDIDKIDKDKIDKTTSLGNYYEHDFESKAVENGHYTHLFICHDEMRAEWNRISHIKYDEIRPDGFPMYATIVRYLTSKNLRKDAEGIKALTPDDIQNIENGIPNVIYQKRKYSLYPRIYQTVWEYYMYSITGNPSYQSFSQRIEFTKAAISIIKNNMWFGVGAGNWKEEFKNAYIGSNSKLKKELYASSHNQYLNYMVKFGVVGFIVIMFFFIFPVVKTRSYRDPLFLIFLVYLFFANFADSNFESHMGSSFFMFFYCLFIVQPDDMYLILPASTSGYRK